MTEPGEILSLDAVLTELLAKVCDDRGWPTEARHIREDSVFNGSVTIGNVREALRRAYAFGRATPTPAGVGDVLRDPLPLPNPSPQRDLL